MTRVSDLGQYNQTLSNLRNTQTTIDTLSAQAGTGFKSTTYSGIASGSRQLVSLESALSRNDQYKTNNQTVQLRLQTMEQSTTSLVTLATNFKTLLTNALNNQNVSDLDLSEQTQNMLNEAARQLNAKVGDRYVFSGTKTDTPPVDLNDPDFVAPPTSYPSTPDTSYYQGDSTRLSTQAAENYTVNYGATADEPAFEKLVRSLKLASTVTTDPLDRDRLNDALDLVNSAIQDMPNITSRIGAAETALDNVTTGNDDLKVYLNQSVTDITSVNVPETMTRLTSEQTLLQASYMTISTLSQLNLASYLR
ncbi:MAG TPA: flagellin [Alphaproteobacteria bacterium]|jgi:flagellar hook-associated protein 3 FlgL